MQTARVALFITGMLIVAVPFALSLLDRSRSSFRSIYALDVERGLARSGSTTLVTEQDLSKLPPLVQTYLRRVGVIGKPRVHDVRARWSGRMKRAPRASWMKVRIEQHNFFDEPSRFFLLDASLFGIPFQALHRYLGSTATMQVRVAGLVGIVDARGPEMNRGETVTMFNDMCILAPATLVDARVEWQTLDAHSVRATFTNAVQTISAELFFDDQGDLVNFVSGDRYQSADGKSYKVFPWSTPLRDYRYFGEQRIASRGEAIWKQPDGDLVYAQFELMELEYNIVQRGSTGIRVGDLAPIVGATP
jgi:hypothetical protein